ncbi:ATP-binding cassette domain-containing protein [Aliiroseovarius sp. KMU-50]|uniref:ATP-binding cassette domain-containing protein n=1 Tax=Aliiroseovarius salicola TaxID=3009082 RepID=A0ABT4W4D0_9RHOB|nr:ATP-binding cassette domain-containing protein [Aliiroseovarius sp. KMU-50]MDA5094667.1 ATP-binding cassette domain-containing protein [Aliiroseovarius sp. KMU-50]
MLKLDLLCKSFAGHSVLEDIHLDLRQGDRVAVMGPSGIGKTTLLRIIAGLDTRFRGVRKTPDEIALMFQNPTLLNWRTAEENLRIFHPDAGEREVRQALKQVGLEEKASHYPQQLSVGQQRRLALARCFLTAAPLVLLDEPFTSLDPSLRSEMLSLTREFLDQSNSTMVLVTHSHDEAIALGARCFQLFSEKKKSAELVAI